VILVQFKISEYTGACFFDIGSCLLKREREAIHQLGKRFWVICFRSRCIAESPIPRKQVGTTQDAQSSIVRIEILEFDLLGNRTCGLRPRRQQDMPSRCFWEKMRIPP
jgi:hypothetical protein